MRALCPYLAEFKREDTERVIFVWPKIIVDKMWVSRYGPIAQCFKYVGTFTPRYTLIKYNFLTFGKIIYQNNWVQIYVQITKIPLIKISGHYSE